MSAPFMYDDMYMHYYHMYEPSEQLVLHEILNMVRPSFPLELTNIIIDFVVKANKGDTFKSLFVISRRERVLDELVDFKLSVVGIASPKSSRWVKNVNPVTWLETIAYDQALAVFNSDPISHSLVLEYPYLRKWLAEAGLKSVNRANLQPGPDVYERFCINVKAALRTILSALIEGLK